MNVMENVVLDKVTVNIGTGTPGERLDNAKELLKKLTKRTPIETLARKRNPVWKLRKGLAIGAKVTLRKKAALTFLEKSLVAKRKMLKEGNFDNNGNFSFGIKEYIDFPESKYDPKIGMMGFDVCVTLAKLGKRVAMKKIKNSKVGKGNRVTKQEALNFAKSLNVKIE